MLTEVNYEKEEKGRKNWENNGNYMLINYAFLSCCQFDFEINNLTIRLFFSKIFDISWPQHFEKKVLYKWF